MPLRPVGADDFIVGKGPDPGLGLAFAVGYDGGFDLAQDGTQSAVVCHQQKTLT